MGSNLHDKINSYAIERGYELNEAVTTNPQRTGTTTSTASLFLNSPSNITFEPNGGPIGGAGCWKFTQTTVASNNGRATIPNAQLLPSLSDNDWTIGFWFKWGTVPTSYAGYLTNIGNSSAAGYYISFQNSTAGANYGKIRLDTTNGLNALSTSKILDTNWHYISVRRINLPTIVYQLYIDGQLEATGTSTTTTVPTAGTQMGSSSAQTGTLDLYFSNWHIASSSVLGPTEIQEIWLAGSTLPNPRTVKYYDGSSWQTSSAQKVWNGTAWVDWNAKKYDGSQWVTI